MGIDIYLLWDGQTKKEKKAQYTGFSVTHGHVGYLREAYHGGPYMTEFLVAEAFKDSGGNGVCIPAKILRERLEQACEILKERSLKIYKEPATEDELRSVADFVALATKLEKEGKRPRVYASY
jgi:hypothetical protein